MGCWNGTCMISNLPIIAGEKIKMVFLHRPYGGEGIPSSAYCYPNGIFHVGAFPIEGKYDDYGSIEEIVEDQNYKMIEKYFQEKYKKIEVENKVLDKFTLPDIISGMERGSLKVLSEGNVSRKKLAIQAMEAYKDNPNAKEHWKELAEMDVSEQWRKSNHSLVMIRADIWDYVVKNHKTEFWKEEEDRKGSDDYYQTAQEWVEKRFRQYDEQRKSLMSKVLPRSLSLYGNPLSMGGYAGGNTMFMNEIYADALDENITYFQKAFTEFILIESFLSSTRKAWMVGTGAGSQSQEWNAYLMLNKIVEKICKKNLEDEQDEDLM